MRLGFFIFLLPCWSSVSVASSNELKEVASIYSSSLYSHTFKREKTNEEALRYYATLEYLSPDIVELKSYVSKERSFLINDPYVLTKVDKTVVWSELLTHLRDLCERKHLAKISCEKKLKTLKTNFYSLIEKSPLFAFDGGAETKCESPAHRLIIFTKNTLAYFDLDTC